MDRAEIGRRLRRLREDAGYSLRAARDVCGVSVPTLQAIESGSALVTTRSLARYAEAFGLAISVELREETQCDM